MDRNDVMLACLKRMADEDCEKPQDHPLLQVNGHWSWGWRGSGWCPYNWPGFELAWCLPCLARDALITQEGEI